jgi:hypothetical protein
MAEKAGAALTQLDLTGPQTVAYDTGHGAVSLTAVRYNGAILVNKNGDRFANELGNTAVLGKAIASQPTGYAWLIFDQTSVDHAKVMQSYKESGYFVEAPTVEGLFRPPNSRRPSPRGTGSMTRSTTPRSGARIPSFHASIRRLSMGRRSAPRARSPLAA